MARNARQGFSLVELSIVLVILGLLTGGILGGQALIHAAELRKVTTEYQSLQTAVNSFRIKYNSLPGDFGKAEQFWPGACGEIYSGSTGCNGDNDGLLQLAYVDGLVAAEQLGFWVHLAKAGLDSAWYQEETDLLGKPSTSGKGAWSVNGYLFASPQASEHEEYFFSAVNKSINYFLLWDLQAIMSNIAAMAGGDFSGVSGALLKTEDAWQIDRKMDDGRPGSGAVTASVGHPWIPNDCAVLPNGSAAARGDAATAEYDLSQTTPSCLLVLPMQ